ncbi:MAG: LamG domain-containing protein, partial [Bacteroidetes bacterium]|nr:LamG domain-containing protein [Bacteroidota bacterium]
MGQRKLLISLLVVFGWLGVIAQNNCLEFNGTSQYVSVPDNSSLDLSSAMTLEFWVYLSGTDGKVVLSKSNSDADENFRIYIKQADDQIYFDYGNETQYAQTYEFTLNLSTWYHMAFSVSAGNPGKIYVNGVEATTYSPAVANAPTPIPTNTHAMEIGGGTAYPSYFAGKLDEVRIWNDIRTEDEIRQNMYRELPDPASETNLVAYYKLNSTSGTTATDSKGSNTGTLTNMTGSEWQTSSAIFGPKNCLEFSGATEHVKVATLSPSFTQGTISFWIKPKATPVNHARVLSDYWDDDEIYLSSGVGKVATWHMIDGDELMSSNPLPNNKWTHVAITMDNSSSKLYINGVLDDESGPSDTDISTDFEIGGYSTSGNYEVVNGYLDEFRIWSVVRTEKEIREYMCKNLTGNEDNLIAYYNFDNVSGITLQDFSGNGNDGTLTNMDNSDWVYSSAYNFWLNTSSSSWSTATNWSRGSVPLVNGTANLGIFSYSGGTAPVFANSSEDSFDNVVLDMSSDWSLGDWIQIKGNLILESNMDLNGNSIYLIENAMLVEDEGRLYGSSGNIQISRILNNINENVAGLGAEISTSANMGYTTISRTHSASSNPVSIERNYNIVPSNNSGLNATLAFHYHEDELNGQAENDLVLYKSSDGANWSRQNSSSVNTNANIITLTGIDGFSHWTASEGHYLTGNALDFDDASSQDVLIPDHDDFDFTTNYTLEAWFYYT